MAPKNGARSNKFSIVIHDVTQADKALLQNCVQAIFSPVWFLVALEEYNHQEGYHLHLFLEYDRSRFVAKSTVLKKIQNLKIGKRVQCDYGKGSFEQCEKYLQGATKEKHIDDDLVAFVSQKKYKQILQDWYDTNPLFYWYDSEGHIQTNTSFHPPQAILNRGAHFSQKIISQDNVSAWPSSREKHQPNLERLRNQLVDLVSLVDLPHPVL